MKTGRRGKNDLPPYVVAFKGKRGTTYASWIPLGRAGKKRWTPRLETPELAAMAREKWLEKRDDLPKDSLTFEAAVENVVARLRREVKRPGTIAWFKEHSELLKKAFGPKTALARITVQRIEEWRDEELREGRGKKMMSPATLEHRRRALSLIFRDNASRLIGGNPLKEMTSGWPTVTEKEATFLPMAELADLIEKIRSSGRVRAAEDADVLAALALTGLRRAEFCRLRVQDVRLADRQIAVRGKRRDEVMALGTEAIAVLARIVERAKACGEGIEALIFPRGPRGLSSLAERWADATGEKRLRAHTLRHSFVTGLMRSGLPIADAMRLARHKSVTMTQRYYHGSGAESEALSRLSLAPQGKGPRAFQGEEQEATTGGALEADLRTEIATLKRLARSLAMQLAGGNADAAERILVEALAGESVRKAL